MSKSVLIVEDEFLIAMLLKNELIKAGYKFCSHETEGEKAVITTKEKKPDIIIMDIRLAGSIDGIDSALKIRSFSNCPIIFTTGYDNATIKNRLNKINRSFYLIKPVAIEKLCSIIESFY